MEDKNTQQMDVKQNLASNIAKYRKAQNLTQVELAEKLNYSDKAVSKWERGEAVPDLSVLKQIADLFGVKIDTLIQEPTIDKPKPVRNITKKRAIISLCSAGLVWLVAICFYAFINIIIPSIERTWMSFIVALPITFIVLFVLTSVWGKSIINTILLSLLVWTAILAIYLCLLFLLTSPPIKLWYIFLVGIPLQALIIFWFLYRKVK